MKSMTQKQYEKWFKEKFGVEPFTNEEVNEIKAILFDVGQSFNVYGKVNRFFRYYKYSERIHQIEEHKRQEDEYWEELASYAY